MASQGEIQLFRTLHQMVPRPQDSPVKIGPLPMNTIDEVVKSQQIVMRKVTAGELTPTQGLQLNAMLETRCKFIETHDLSKRIQALEQAHRKSDHPE